MQALTTLAVLIIALDSFDQPQLGYRGTVGGEFPGAKAVFAWTPDGRSGPGALKIDYDFSGGGNYVGWLYDGFLPPGARRLSANVHSPVAVTMVVRLSDSAGQTVQRHISLPAGSDWQEFALDVTEAFDEHWGGPDDGRVHPPLTGLMIGLEKPAPGAVGSLRVDDVAVTTTAPAGNVMTAWMAFFAERPMLSIAMEVPGNLFYPSDPVCLKVAAPNPPQPAELALAGTVRDVAGKVIAEIDATPLRAENAYVATLDKIPASPGFYEAELRLAVAGKTKTQQTRYAVIPANPALDRLERESPFGTNTHFNQWWPAEVGAIVKRAGIAWIRDGEATPDDKALPVAKTSHLCYMPCFTSFRDPQSWLKKDSAGRWDFSEAVEFHRRFAKAYGDYVDCYDLMNEPHGSWGAMFGGSWWGGDWLKTFADYGRQVTAAIHEADPGSTVLWEDVDQLLWYKQFYDLGAADTIDGISPHPYNLHRNRPLPEEQGVLEQIGEFDRFVREHKLPWKLYHGEVGFSSFRLGKTSGGFYTPCSEMEQAQLLVRMYVLHLAHGVERIFWYDFMNDGEDPCNQEHNFGMIRRDLLPKPAVAAYANLIARLRGAKWLGRYTIGGGGDAYAFVAENADKPTLIAWVRRGSKTEPIPVPSSASQVEIADIFGATTTLAVEDHKLNLPLTESPVYVTGLAASDLAGLVENLIPDDRP